MIITHLSEDSMRTSEWSYDLTEHAQALLRLCVFLGHSSTVGVEERLEVAARPGCEQWGRRPLITAERLAQILAARAEYLDALDAAVGCGGPCRIAPRCSEGWVEVSTPGCEVLIGPEYWPLYALVSHKAGGIVVDRGTATIRPATASGPTERLRAYAEALAPGCEVLIEAAADEASVPT
jgi:hypothetical protein